MKTTLTVWVEGKAEDAAYDLAAIGRLLLQGYTSGRLYNGGWKVETD